MEPITANRNMLAQAARARAMRGPANYPTDQGLMNSIAMGTSMVPVLGDIAGLAADAHMYANEPESRNMLNYLLTAAGVLPGIPAASAARAMRENFRGAKDVKSVRSKFIENRPTVTKPERVAYPGVYKPTNELVADVKNFVAPESPMLQELFGVTRADLAKLGERTGNIDDPMRELIAGLPQKMQGASAAERVTTKKNAARVANALSAAQEQVPELVQGMKGWYPMDPAYQRLLELTGDEKEALRRYNQFNTFGGIESPNMPVADELRRAAAANHMAESGRWGDWVQYGGLPQARRNELGVIQDLAGVPGRVGHVRSAGSMTNYLNTGSHGMQSPKAPLYIAASGVPQGRFQTSVPVGDAHFSRALGLSDVRTNKGFDASISTPELSTITPWFRDIARAQGLNEVPGQAILWGMMAPQTGVKTAIGAPKLEILADLIARRGGQVGASTPNALRELRDEILMGKNHLGRIDPTLLMTMGAAGATGMGLRELDRRREPPPPPKPGVPMTVRG